MSVPTPTGSRRLVPPEFLAALDRFPAMDLTAEMLPHRLALMARYSGRGDVKDAADWPWREDARRRAADEGWVPGLNLEEHALD